MRDIQRKEFVQSNVMIDFFLNKLFEENLIDTDTYVFAKNMAKEELRDGTQKQIYIRTD